MKVIYLILSILISVKLETSHCFDDQFKDASFIFVNGLKNTDPYVVVPFNDTQALLQHPKFNKDRDTVLYCFGYTENYTADSTQAIVDAYLWRNDHNILVVQWSMYNADNYFFQAIPNTIRVSFVSISFGNLLLIIKSSSAWGKDWQSLG